MIDSFVKVKPAGGVGDVIIGGHTYINSGCVLFSGNGIHMATTLQSHQDKEAPISSQGFLPSKVGISIEDDVWIGANWVFLDGAIIGQGGVVGTGSIARGKLDSYGIDAGAPLLKIGGRK